MKSVEAVCTKCGCKYGITVINNTPIGNFFCPDCGNKFE